ncbi:hypothetical protein FRB95_012073 [Tulasnella sp. JGI-2019a]|nr:hypothetical protein FRB95_012073 [Tulasnella sp. JGI-2019a]
MQAGIRPLRRDGNRHLRSSFPSPPLLTPPSQPLSRIIMRFSVITPFLALGWLASSIAAVPVEANIERREPSPRHHHHHDDHDHHGHNGQPGEHGHAGHGSHGGKGGAGGAGGKGGGK